MRFAIWMESKFYCFGFGSYVVSTMQFADDDLWLTQASVWHPDSCGDVVGPIAA